MSVVENIYMNNYMEALAVYKRPYKKEPEKNNTAVIPHEEFSLIDEVEVIGFNGKKSSLLVFEKCFT